VLPASPKPSANNGSVETFTLASAATLSSNLELLLASAKTVGTPDVLISVTSLRDLTGIVEIWALIQVSIWVSSVVKIFALAV
jgi:hypothetical protein